VDSVYHSWTTVQGRSTVDRGHCRVKSSLELMIMVVSRRGVHRGGARDGEQDRGRLSGDKDGRRGS
jgi:hypothetical protein